MNNTELTDVWASLYPFSSMGRRHPSGKTHVPLKEGDAILFMEAEIDPHRFKDHPPRPDVHLSGEDPLWEKLKEYTLKDIQVVRSKWLHDECIVDYKALEEKITATPGARKHPGIYLARDLINDPSEWARMEWTVAEAKEDDYPVAPIAIQTSDLVESDGPQWLELLDRLSAFQKKENVWIVISRDRHELKNMLFPFLYGATMPDLVKRRAARPTGNLVVVMEPPFKAKEKESEEAKAMAKLREGKSKTLLAITGAMVGSARDMYGIDIQTAVQAISDNELRIGRHQFKDDWSQSKLRCGKGHNKLKRKGKK